MTVASPRRKRLAFLSVALAAVVLSAVQAALPRAAQAQKVYIGSANGWDTMIAHPEQWAFVRKHADGFYVNFIQMLNPDAKKCALTAALFTHKNAYYESDSRYTGLGGFPNNGQFSRALQAQELGALLDGGFQVPYTSLNYGVDAAKLADLKHQGLPDGKTRPCFAQNGPWTINGGDITKDLGGNARMRADTILADGASTDGPLSLWQVDQGQMHSGSFSLVKYAHGLHKTAAVMVAPYDLKPVSRWLEIAQQCVRQHEDAGAKPDIWIVFEYATKTPTLPETVAGKPADTITGMAYWLIHHVQDPKHWAHLTVSPNVSGTPSSVTLRNDSAWLDLCPVLYAQIAGSHPDWAVRFRLNGEDVTDQITQKSGLAFVGSKRLWPGDTRHVQVFWERLPTSRAARSAPPEIVFGLRPNLAYSGPLRQQVTLRPSAEPIAAHLASRSLRP
jgi:hypothetical protein